MNSTHVPPRTVSSGTPVDPSRLGHFKRQGNSPNMRPGEDSLPKQSTETPPPEQPPVAPTHVFDEEPCLEGLRLHYSPDEMNRIAERIDDDKFLTDAVREWGARLWPEGSKRPERMWTREGLFSDKERMKKDRKMSNLVLGILGRITPENYDALKNELLALPIRQSTDEDITDVVKLMYMKAIRPEDAIFTEIYARLMADLVEHTGVNGVGKVIRKAIIDKCQQQFEAPFVIAESEKLDANGNALPPEEIELKVSLLRERLRCNIKFLGDLFICGMVSEKVVSYVLYRLLYGDAAKDATKDKATPQRRRAEDYEIELFCELLKKTARKLSPKTHHDYVVGYMKSLENIRSKLSPRLRFMLMDLEELWQAGWEPRVKRGEVSGPMKIADFAKYDAEMRAKEQEEAQRGGKVHTSHHQHASAFVQPASSIPHRQIIVVEKETVPLPPRDSVYPVLESFTQDGAPSTVESFFRPLPQHERIGYLIHWAMRIIHTVKKVEDRKKFGFVVDALINGNLIGGAVIDKGFMALAEQFASERHYDDYPKLFHGWFEVVASCRRHPSPVVHNTLLTKLIQYGAPQETILLMTRTVLESSDPNASHRDPHRRFRPLSALLKYSPPLPDAEDYPADGEEEADDIIAKLLGESNLLKEPEINVFASLADGMPPASLVKFIQGSDLRIEPSFYPRVMSAVFTYLRCDVVGTVTSQMREPIATLFKAAPAPPLVVEAFLTWCELDRLPAASFRRLMERLRALELVKPSNIEEAKSLLSKIDPSREAEFNAELEKISLVMPPAVTVTHSAARGRGGR